MNKENESVKKSTYLANPYFISTMFQKCFFIHFQDLMMKRLRHNYYNKQTTIGDNSNVQSHDQEENKLNNAIIAKNGAHTLTDDKIIKIPFNKNNVVTIKNK